MGKNLVTVLKLNPEHCIGKVFYYCAANLYCLFFWHYIIPLIASSISPAHYQLPLLYAQNGLKGFHPLLLLSNYLLKSVSHIAPYLPSALLQGSFRFLAWAPALLCRNLVSEALHEKTGRSHARQSL